MDPYTSKYSQPPNMQTKQNRTISNFQIILNRTRSNTQIKSNRMQVGQRDGGGAAAMPLQLLLHPRRVSILTPHLKSLKYGDSYLWTFFFFLPDYSQAWSWVIQKSMCLQERSGTAAHLCRAVILKLRIPESPSSNNFFIRDESTRTPQLWPPDTVSRF